MAMDTMKQRMRDMAQSDQREGPVARMIEDQTAKLPSDTFLWAAMGSLTGALVMEIMGKKDAALFIGQLAPTFLILGLYNKIVKIAGHDWAD